MLAARIFRSPLRSLLGLVFAASLIACAGATDTELDDQPAGAGSATNPTEPGRGDDDSSSKTGATPSSPGASKNDTKTPGPRTDDDPEDEPGKQPPPPAACAVEVEDNNSEAKAVVFSGCMTGKLASKSDADFFKVVAPKDATKMLIQHKETNGKVLYRVTQENGFPILGTTMFTEDAPEIDVQGGQTYVLRLTVPMSQGGGERPYEMVVSFE